MYYMTEEIEAWKVKNTQEMQQMATATGITRGDP